VLTGGLAGAAPSGNGGVTLNFAAADIHAAVDQILGGILHVNYTIDPEVTGTVTFHTVTPLPRDALIPALQTLLAQNNAVLVETDGLYRVIPVAQGGAPELAASAALGGATVLHLRYVSAVDLAIALHPFFTQAGEINFNARVNDIVFRGDPATRAGLLALARAFDVDMLAGKSFRLFPAANGDARDFAAAFSAALTRQDDDQGTDAVTVVPLERINAVLVIARTQNDVAEAARIYALLSQAQNEGARSWHVFTLRNSRANDAAYLLQQAFTSNAMAARPTPANAQSGTDDSGAAAATNPAAPLAASQTGATGTGLQIIPDVQKNAVLANATAREARQIEAMLAEIDVMPVQVRIDATIAEVRLTGALQYGTQFFFKSGGLNAVLSSSATDALATSFPGFVLSGHGSDAAPVAISALQSLTQVQVLSAPELTVLNGQTANLQVGDLVPYLTQAAQSTASTNTAAINSISYRATGVIMNVTPYIGGDGLVTLDISQEVGAVSSGITTPGINSPTFTDRAVTSRIAIQNGQTLGLAGFISDSDSHGNSGLPWLRAIPLLGDLFSSQTNHHPREEMLVLITPHVIRTQEQALDLTADLREHLADAALVPAGGP
jgi:general secretion pathway protein D